MQRHELEHLIRGRGDQRLRGNRGDRQPGDVGGYWRIMVRVKTIVAFLNILSTR